MRALLRWAGALLLVLVLAALAVIWLADTSVGHRFIADRIEGMRPASGLRVKVGRIEGSIYGATRIRDLRLSDSKGQFFQAGQVSVDWSPMAWLSNRLDIDRLVSPAATLDRLPALVPSKTAQPILPTFDIRVGELKIERMTFGEGIVKPARVARITGRADIRDGRALVDLNGAARGGDRLVLKLDSAPDRNVFDVAVAVDAPAKGVIGGMLGATQPLSLRIEGDGSWKDWKGGLIARAGFGELARLALTARSGRYDLNGVMRPSLVTTGRIARLTGPEMRVTGNAMLENRRLDTHVGLASPALALGANGFIDLASSSFDAMKIDVRLRQPQAVLPNMAGRDIAALVMLDGPFGAANFDYRITASRIAFDATGFDNVRVTGRGKLSPEPVIVPLSLSARRVTGVGDIAGGILNNLRVDGLLRVTSKLVTGDGLKVRSDKLNGTVSVIFDLATGRYDVGLSGQLNRYLIPGLGIVDVKSVLKVVPDANGQGVRILGRGQVWVRRLDNSFLAGLAGGLPYIDTALERGADGVIRFTGLKLTARDITITGSGYRRLDGTFFFEGSGRQRQYGPVRLRIDGNIARPKVDLILASPLPSAPSATVCCPVLFRLQRSGKVTRLCSVKEGQWSRQDVDRKRMCLP